MDDFSPRDLVSPGSIDSKNIEGHIRDLKEEISRLRKEVLTVQRNFKAILAKLP